MIQLTLGICRHTSREKTLKGKKDIYREINYINCDAKRH